MTSPCERCGRAAPSAICLAGAEGLTERANTFDEHPVLQAFAGAARQGALVAEVRGAGAALRRARGRHSHRAMAR